MTDQGEIASEPTALTTSRWWRARVMSPYRWPCRERE